MASDNSEESKIAEEVKGPEENDDVIALRARNIPRATGPAQHLEFTPVPAPPPTQEAPRDGPGQRGPPVTRQSPREAAGIGNDGAREAPEPTAVGAGRNPGEAAASETAAPQGVDAVEPPRDGDDMISREEFDRRLDGLHSVCKSLEWTSRGQGKVLGSLSSNIRLAENPDGHHRGTTVPTKHETSRTKSRKKIAEIPQHEKTRVRRQQSTQRPQRKESSSFFGLAQKRTLTSQHTIFSQKFLRVPHLLRAHIGNIDSTRDEIKPQ